MMLSKNLRTAPLYETGLVIGRFMVFHNGHRFLLETAASLCRTLYVCVCSRRDDAVAGDIRCRWIRSVFARRIASGKLRVCHITKELSHAGSDNPDSPRIWAREIARMVPARFDAVFASEHYGWDFARSLNAAFVPVDIQREVVPVSSRSIQRDPYAHWNFLPAPVRASLVTVVGAAGSMARIRAFADAIHAEVYVPYGTRNGALQEGGAAHAVDRAQSEAARISIARAQLAARAHIASRGILCVAFDARHPAAQSAEYGLCEAVFSLGAADAQNSVRDAHGQAARDARTFITSRLDALVRGKLDAKNAPKKVAKKVAKKAAKKTADNSGKKKTRP